MKIQYKTAKCEIEVEGADAKACFDEVAMAIEIFGATTCGACDSTNTVPVVRENKGNLFREMRCVDCGCSLGFGQRKSDGALYPRRKDQDGNLIGTNGWSKWSRREADSPF